MPPPDSTVLKGVLKPLPRITDPYSPQDDPPETAEGKMAVEVMRVAHNALICELAKRHGQLDRFIEFNKSLTTTTAFDRESCEGERRSIERSSKIRSRQTDPLCV